MVELTTRLRSAIIFRFISIGFLQFDYLQEIADAKTSKCFQVVVKMFSCCFKGVFLMFQAGYFLLDWLQHLPIHINWPNPICGPGFLQFENLQEIADAKAKGFHQKSW